MGYSIAYGEGVGVCETWVLPEEARSVIVSTRSRRHLPHALVLVLRLQPSILTHAFFNNLLLCNMLNIGFLCRQICRERLTHVSKFASGELMYLLAECLRLYAIHEELVGYEMTIANGSTSRSKFA